MHSDKQERMCARASMNAQALEEYMLTPEYAMSLDKDEAEDIVDRCEQIILCMRQVFGVLTNKD